LCRSNRVRTNIHNDNSCFCGAAGFVSVAEINEVDIIYAQFDNDLYRLPFVVCLDHDTGSVVVTVRGTLSMHDIITDLIANVHPIELPGWPMFMVHKGMYQSALYIKELLEDGVLELAFDKAPQYKLVIAGHSLGSGCACILAILLQEEFPDVHCYCFSPSGSLLNATAAIYTQSFVTSVTLGQDVVCRLNVVTANKMKHQVIKALETCRKPKYRIMFEGVLETLGKCCGRDVLFKDVEDNETDSSPDELPLIDDEDHIVLYPPGRLIHIVDTLRERRCFFAQRHLEAQWASAGNFQDITVSPDMLKDHFPDVLFRAMKVIWEEKQNELSNIAII
jgi:sn1-specific diacylglycerol lipase